MAHTAYQVGEVAGSGEEEALDSSSEGWLVSAETCEEDRTEEGGGESGGGGREGGREGRRKQRRVLGGI